ncbi:MAG: trimeric intracellular cation channel family protein [Flavobacteriaceae bacterium]|nr:trimeric intracellular cation channel family protein [Flavobacteriaceae bacterium]
MFYFAIDILGTISFAISGVLTAMHKRLDVFGVFIIAFVTATGGGTLRDLLLGNTPVGWLQKPVYMFTIIGSVIFAMLFRKYLKYFRKSLFLFDTIGLGLYTLVGLTKGLDAGLNPLMCITLGTISASFGGVIRDILCNEIPVIFHKEIYATCSILGGLLYYMLFWSKVPPAIAYSVAIGFIILFRLAAVKWHWSLPTMYRE